MTIADNNPTTRGIHHLALTTEDMKMTAEFLSEFLVCRWSTP